MCPVLACTCACICTVLYIACTCACMCTVLACTCVCIVYTTKGNLQSAPKDFMVYKCQGKTHTLSRNWGVACKLCWAKCSSTADVSRGLNVCCTPDWGLALLGKTSFSNPFSFVASSFSAILGKRTTERAESTASSSWLVRLGRSKVDVGVASEKSQWEASVVLVSITDGGVHVSICMSCHTLPSCFLADGFLVFSASICCWCSWNFLEATFRMAVTVFRPKSYCSRLGICVLSRSRNVLSFDERSLYCWKPAQ